MMRKSPFRRKRGDSSRRKEEGEISDSSSDSGEKTETIVYPPQGDFRRKRGDSSHKREGGSSGEETETVLYPPPDLAWQEAKAVRDAWRTQQWIGSSPAPGYGEIDSASQTSAAQFRVGGARSKLKTLPPDVYEQETRKREERLAAWQNYRTPGYDGSFTARVKADARKQRERKGMELLETIAEEVDARQRQDVMRKALRSAANQRLSEIPSPPPREARTHGSSTVSDGLHLSSHTLSNQRFSEMPSEFPSRGVGGGVPHARPRAKDSRWSGGSGSVPGAPPY